MKRYLRSTSSIVASNNSNLYICFFDRFDAFAKQLFYQLTGVEANKWNYSGSEGAYGYIATLSISKTSENDKAVKEAISNITYNTNEFNGISYRWRYDEYNADWKCIIEMDRNKDASTREYDRFRSSL